MTSKPLMNDEETIRFFRAAIKRNNFKMAERRKNKDRRTAFFSYVPFDRRVLPERRKA